MKLHTNLTGAEVCKALSRAKARGLITSDVHFVIWDKDTPSRTHPHGIDLQLGTYEKDSLPRGTLDQHGHKMNVRRYKNTGNRGANSDSEWAGNEGIWAATWHEWGWFIAEIFAADPAARFGANPARCARPEYAGGYASPADFHAKTGYRFTDLPPLPPLPPPPPAHLAADPVVFGPETSG
jgi:hypothetical protein